MAETPRGISENPPRGALPRGLCVITLEDVRGVAEPLADDFCGALACYAGPETLPLMRWRFDASGFAVRDGALAARREEGAPHDSVMGFGGVTAPKRSTDAAKSGNAIAPENATITESPADAPADAIVCIAPDATEHAGTNAWEPAASHVLSKGGARAGARLYLITAVSGDAPPRETPITWRDMCDRSGFVWSGGVVAAGADALPRLMRSPRLGRFRRPLSEAIDALVAAVRLGCAYGDLPRVLNNPVTDTPAPPASAPAHGEGLDDVTLVPRPFLYRWFARP